MRDIDELLGELDRNAKSQDYFLAVIFEDAAAALREAQARLKWYDDHKQSDGSYDGELFGDLSAVSPPADEANH